MKQPFLPYVAAALMAASAGAHAIKLVTLANDDPAASTAMSSFNYAQETLLKTGALDETSGTYYRIARTHHVSGTVGLYKEVDAEDTYTIKYDLEGMVFAAAPTAEVLTYGNLAAIDIQVVTGDVDIIRGGFAGDNTVTFRAAGAVLPTAGVPNDNPPVPRRRPLIRMSAVFAISEGGVGSITRTVVTSALSGQDSETHSLGGAIRTLPALVETITPADATATAASLFTIFRGNAPMVASMGSIVLDVVGGTAALGTTRYRDAQAIDTDLTAFVENPTTGDDGIVTTVGEAIGTESDATKHGMTFSSRQHFQFPSKVTVGPVCNAGGTDIRMMDTATDMYADRTKPQGASGFTTAMSLCIHVDGETTIPVTDNYMVTTKYAGITGAAFPPPSSMYDLGMIERDGTTYHIPYLTTFDGYNQRIAVVNRSGRTVDYVFTDFMAEDGNTVTGGEAHSGTFSPGQTVLRATDIVTIEGGARAAANLTIVADPSVISAATQTVNIVSQGTDTVYLQHMLQ